MPSSREYLSYIMEQLAPLEGITGWLFRRVHHSRFPGLARYYTPFSAPTADSPLTGRPGGRRESRPLFSWRQRSRRDSPG